MAKDNEKAEILNAFIATVLIVRTVGLWVLRSLGWKIGMWIRMKPQ